MVACRRGNKVQYLCLCYLSYIYIYINDLSQASNIFKFIMHVVDTTLFRNLKYFGNDIQTKEYSVNAELSNVIELVNVNKL